MGATKPMTLSRIWFLKPTTTAQAINITMMAKATLVTASRITVEDKFSFESEKIRSAMNFGPDICSKFNNFAKVKIKLG